MASITNLGKRRYVVLRDSQEAATGDWVDGEWVQAKRIEVPVIANVQPSFTTYRTKLLPVGDREKEAIAIYSNDWLHMARKGVDPLEADILLYRGAQWKVVVSNPYGNYGEHCEAMAVKLDDSITVRLVGEVGVIQ